MEQNLFCINSPSAGLLSGTGNKALDIPKFIRKSWWLVPFLFWALVSFSAHGAPPNLQTPEPVIYLADNLDEQDKLGWCIDTVGRGFSDRLHAHSCKPRGGDVQFYYNSALHQIVSATFSGKCATLSSSAATGVSLGLVDCSASSTKQLFDYNKQTSEFRPQGDHTLCLVVGKASRSAGPFMSRKLQLATCNSTDAKYRKWRAKGGRN